MRSRRGSTLLELVATLAIMGVVAGVVTLALRTPSASRAERDPVVEARRRAIMTRRPVTVALQHDAEVHAITALPDGGVAADSVHAIDRLTGERHDARR